MTVHLETSLTFFGGSQFEPIDYKTFQDPMLHFVIKRKEISEYFRVMAMKEASIINIPVGGSQNAKSVEFYAFDLKSRESIFDSLGTTLQLSWIDTTHTLFRQSIDAKSNFLDDIITSSLDELADLLELRRFLKNALGASARKKKLSKLLFHHAVDNGPRE